MIVAINDTTVLRNQLKVIYDDYRTALLNRKYYGERLHKYRTINRTVEFVIAAGATGSSIAAWAIWGSETGQIAWASIAGASSLIAIGKPIVNITGDIERYTKLYAGYSTIFLQIKKLSMT